LERIFAFDSAKNANSSLSAENEGIIPTRPILANPADTLVDTNANAVSSTVPIAQMSHQCRDLSGLCLSTSNPWGSLRCRYYSHYSHTPRRFTR
jgi:hypothetical protein